MKQKGVRSPAAKVSGLIYFGRMLDKIRANDRGDLSEDHTPNLGKGFDGSCCEFLGINYAELVERVRIGGSDEEILEWAFSRGRRPKSQDIHIWNEWMRKRGWNDEVTEVLQRRKKQSDFEKRDDIQTMFQYIDADEEIGAPA